jgi:glycogen synthase
LYRYFADNWIMPSITLKNLKFDHTTCISKQLKKNLLDRGTPIENSKVIYQGIPIERFPIKNNPGKLHNPVRVLYVGQLHTYKGVHNVINAAHRVVKEKGSDYLNVTIIGSGPENYRSELIKIASRGQAQINFTGQVEHTHLPKIYRKHDIFVFSSIWQEPFGLTHLEAMASGTPVISTNDGGHGEFLVHNQNALVFEKENEDELAQHIISMVEDDDLRNRLIISARKIVEEQFVLNKYVDRLEHFLIDAKEQG